MGFEKETKIGISRGTSIEEAVQKNFEGETKEVGLYLAMARQAEREGYPEVAAAMKAIALDEAWHAARYAELNGLISESTEENLRRMREGEGAANRGKWNSSLRAKEAGVEEAQDVFSESAADEARHAKTLDGLLRRYFP
jgi:rubrerythrin